MYDPLVSVYAPDASPDDPPIYEGRAWHAKDHLVPGVYPATMDMQDLCDTDEDPRPGVVVVNAHNDFPTLFVWPEHPGAKFIDATSEVCMASGAPANHVPWSNHDCDQFAHDFWRNHGCVGPSLDYMA